MRTYAPTPRRLGSTLRYILAPAAAAALTACATSTATTRPTPAPPSPSATPVMRDGMDVLRAMHDRYATTWYRNLTFKQTTTIHPPSGRPLVQTWWEAGVIPGRLRIDTDSVGKGTGVLFRSDSLYEFVGGKLARVRADVNELLVLGFDVYREPVERTAELLRGLGFDLSRVHADSWRGMPVWVVGAVAGDTTAKQFWVERDRLLFVRLREQTKAPNGGTRQVDLRFDNYVPHEGGWVAEKVVQLVDGKPRLTEEYAEVRVNVDLDEGIFDPARWMTARHWAR